MPLREREARWLLRRVLDEGIFRVSFHAQIEMDKDNLTDADVVNVLRGGVVYPAEWENGSWRYRVMTRKLAVVAAMEPDPNTLPSEKDDVSDMELVVITAWRIRQ